MALIPITRADGSVVTCDTENRTLVCYRCTVSFTKAEWKIFFCLYEHNPTAVTRKELLSLLWDDQKFETSSANTRTIDVHVGVIKKKLSKIKGFRIDTVYGVGYRRLLTRRV